MQQQQKVAACRFRISDKDSHMQVVGFKQLPLNNKVFIWIDLKTLREEWSKFLVYNHAKNGFEVLHKGCYADDKTFLLCNNNLDESYYFLFNKKENEAPSLISSSQHYLGVYCSDYEKFFIGINDGSDAISFIVWNLKNTSYRELFKSKWSLRGIHDGLDHVFVLRDQPLHFEIYSIHKETDQLEIFFVPPGQVLQHATWHKYLFYRIGTTLYKLDMTHPKPVVVSSRCEHFSLQEDNLVYCTPNGTNVFKINDIY